MLFIDVALGYKIFTITLHVSRIRLDTFATYIYFDVVICMLTDGSVCPDYDGRTSLPSPLH